MDAASLAISLSSICIQGYRSFQSLKSLGTDAQVILSKIEIQEYRLQGLKQNLEAIKQAHNLCLVKDPIYNTLESIKLLTTDTTHLRNQYKLKLEIRPSIESEETKDEGEAGTPSLPVVKIHKRDVIKWLLFDKTNMEKLAADLKEHTDGLEDLLAMAVRHEFPSSLLRAAITSLATSDPPTLQTIAAASAGTYPDLAADAERKLERLGAEDGLRIESPRQVNLYGMGELSFSASAQEEDGQRTEAMLVATRQVVLVEWRTLPQEFDHRERALARLETTSNILQISRPAAMRTLDCPGYVVDRSSGPAWRAALVYRYPQDAAREAPKSLLRLLDPENRRDGCQPSLDDRYGLALALAETVFSLHMSGWLHRCIGAHNVVFFRKSAGVQKVYLKELYLTGFEFSREGGEGMATETVVEGAGVNRYRHPGCQGPYRAGFRKVHDLYSLGMVLLEIGLWKLVDRAPLFKPTMSPSENRDRIVEKCLNGYLAYYTGNKFQSVLNNPFRARLKLLIYPPQLFFICGSCCSCLKLDDFSKELGQYFVHL